MALDDFVEDISESESEQESDEPEEGEQTEDEEEQTTTEEVPEEPEVGGLEAFKSEEFYDDGEDGETEEKDLPVWIDGTDPVEWNAMSEEERVKKVRRRDIPDFRPEVHTDDRWSYNEAIEVKCVCDETFTFTDTGMCLSCGRTYEMDGRIVRLVDEP